MRSQNNKKYEIDMCSGKIVGKMLMFALPLMISSILQLLFNAADIIVVGRFAGDNSLAAVGSTSSLVNMLTNVFLGLSVGANVMVARYIGAGRDDETSATVHTAVTLALISGLILTIIGGLGARRILTWMGSPDEVIGLSTLYLRIFFLGMIPNMLYNFGAAILRSVGDTRRPLYYLFAAGIINVILNLIFVIVFKMDVAGVALATIISQTISAVLVVRCLILEKRAIRLDIHKLGIDKNICRDILKIGLPSGFQGLLFSMSNVIIQASVNSFGATVIAANSAAANIEGFVWVSMNAFHQAAITFTGQNYGAGKLKRVPLVMRDALICVIVTGVVLGRTVYFFGIPLMGLYTTSAEVASLGLERIKWVCGMYALCGMMDVMVGVLRGVGYSVLPMIVSLVGACGLRLLWIFTLFQTETFHKPMYLYVTYPVSWAVTFIMHVICFVIVWKKIKATHNME
ncbi:MAG: MATE family efflux transporter [Lachnospiraceae bacterium]|nr:MATE family efflux transporter [Lachnospiraceae bacterium]